MNKRLLEHFIQLGFLDQNQARGAMSQQQNSGNELLDVLIQMKFVSEKDAAKCISSFYRYPLIDLNEEVPQDAALAVIDGEYAATHQILPLTADRGSRKVRLATFDPGRTLEAMEFVRRRSGWDPQPCVTEKTALSQAIRYYYFGQMPASPSRSNPQAMGLGRGRQGASAFFNERSNAGRGPDPGSGLRDMPDMSGGGFQRFKKHDPIPKSSPSMSGGDSFSNAGMDGSFDQHFRGGSSGFGGSEGAGFSGGGSSAELQELKNVVEELQTKLLHYEEMMSHERRVVELLKDVLIDSGLLTRDELMKKLRSAG